jgi:hypothetical protein
MVWKDADGGFVASGDSVDFELPPYGTASLNGNGGPVYLMPAVRYVDARGYIWRVDVSTGVVSQWDPTISPRIAGAAEYAGATGYSGVSCDGTAYLVLSPGTTREYLPPRYVYFRFGYWARPDKLMPRFVSLGSMQGGCQNGCNGPLYNGSCPATWPATFSVLPFSEMTPNPPLTKPPDFVGPIHLEKAP